ncbi:MAG: transposase, partial [Patescibacteria group bacterium]
VPTVIDILAYVLMPNHFHFLLRQTKDGGISKFIGQFQNSYTKFFNIKLNRDGSLFLDQFKANLIQDEENLLHIHRYIHLNPATSYIIKSVDNILTYPWSSMGEFYYRKQGICEKEIILSNFKTPKSYLKFHLDQVDYQRKLAKIKHLLHENP